MMRYVSNGIIQEKRLEGLCYPHIGLFIFLTNHFLKIPLYLIVDQSLSIRQTEYIFEAS